MGLLQLFLQGKDVADRELVAKIVVRDGAYVDTVLKGARRERSRYAYSDELHRQWQIPEGLQGASNSLQLLAVCQGKLLSQGGKPREAMELLLDLGLFGRDLSDRAFYIDESDGLGVMGTAFRELQGMVVSGALGQELLTDLEKQLKRLDDLWPDHRTALIGDLLNLGTLLLREDRSDDELYTINNTPRNRREWRYLFSSRFKATRCFNVAEDWIEQAIQAEKQPWEATNRTIQRLFQESRQSKDPLLRELYGILTSMSVREVRATCRLLQMAAHYRATGEILALEDPYGGQLRSSVSGGRLRAWSIGPFPEEYNPAQAKPTGYVRSLELEVDR
jgi:hypothetical protein